MAAQRTVAVVLCSLLSLFVSQAIAQRSIIEFERAEYVVFEDAGQVQIGVRLFDIAPGMQAADGTLNQEIMTRISTVDMTAEATAVDGEGDYDAMDNIMVRFSVGTAESSVQREIFIVINTDMLIEPDETFRVTFEPINVNLGDTDNFDIGGIFETTVTIIDVNVNIGLIPINPVTEGDNAVVCASLTGEPRSTTFPVTFSTSDGTGPNPALAGSDYTATTETRTFAAGATVQCISVPTILDGVNEVTECFNVNIASTQAGVTLNPATVQVCIEDNDPALVAPQQMSYDVPENDGSVLVCVAATNVDGGFTVNYNTEPKNPVDAMGGGVDYVGVSGTFSFDSANTVRCVSVGIVDDTIPEDTECFYFRLNAVGPDVVVTQDPTPIRILDNDRVFGFDPAMYTVDENVATPPPFVVCVRLMQGVLRDGEMVQINLTVVQGVALGGDAMVGPAADFLQVDPSPFPLVFTGANQNQQLCAPVTIVNDMMFEDDESFYALINDPSNDPGIVLAPNMARITIIDDDPPPEEDPTMGIGDDPHFAIFLSSGKLLCYTVQGEHNFVFNLISNDKIHMNALFVPDARREEVTWIGSLGIVLQNTHFQGSNTTRLRFDSIVNQIHINDKVLLEAKNIDEITIRNGKMHISEGPIIEGFHYPSVHVNLEDVGMHLTVNFTGEHLDMIWNKLEGNEHSHGIIGQFLKKGVEIDAARKLLLLPNKDPVPVMRKPVWAYMEQNVRSDQLCWVAMNPGYQGSHLIDGHYLDYVVDNIFSTHFKFECKHTN